MLDAQVAVPGVLLPSAKPVLQAKAPSIFEVTNGYENAPA